jgi:hypothetical protein
VHASSYVILKKGERKKGDPEKNDNQAGDVARKLNHLCVIIGCISYRITLVEFFFSDYVQ